MSEFKCLPEAEREYYLRCKVKRARGSFKNAGQIQHENTMVFLEPVESTQADEFLGQYLPRVQAKARINPGEAWVEFHAFAARPVYRKIKAALCAESKFHPEGPYIHVMSLDAIDILKLPEIIEISIRVVSENEEARIARNAHA